MSNELTLQEAALAWAQGKRVAARPSFRDGEPWNTISRVGSKDSSCWPASILNDPDAYEFRLAPEPPAKRYRPWTPEEVPVGALIRHKRVAGVGLILGNGASSALGIAFVDKFQIRREPCGMALDNYEHSLDNGKTWLPCGVEVEA